MKRIILCCILFLTVFCYNVKSIYVYTTFGRAVEVESRSDYGFDKEYWNWYYQTTYPQATYLATATQTYNCHFFAWHMSDGGSGVYWMNPGSNNNNISKYWTDAYYGQVSSTNAAKIHYYSSDHSAIVSSVSGMYESKWGPMPLMRHAPDYGPYPNMSNRNYYAHIQYHGLLDPNGYGETYVDVTNYYLAPYLGNNVYGVWVIYNAREEEEGYTQKPSGNMNTVVFQTQGIYQMYYNLFLISTDEPVGDQWYEVLVEI